MERGAMQFKINIKLYLELLQKAQVIFFKEEHVLESSISESIYIGT
jgi:hypothetical protein